MKTIFFVFFLLALASCQKEEDLGMCSCQRQYEKYDIYTDSTGVNQLGWLLDYYGPPGQDSCAAENGEYVYHEIGKRYTVICN